LYSARLSTNISTKWSLYIPPYLKDVDALPCETIVFQKLHKFKNTVLVLINKITTGPKFYIFRSKCVYIEENPEF